MSSVVERTAVVPAPAGARHSAFGLLQGVVIALGFAMMVGGFGVIALNYRTYRIPTASMSPTVKSGDTLLARKVDGGSVGRGDIVIFREPLWGGEVMVKRVVAVGGDTVASDDQHRLLVNGTPVDEPYLAKQTAPEVAFSTKVPAGRLFLTGDFRGNSLDSRYHLTIASGTVATSDVMARVEATVMPIGRAGFRERTSAFDQLGGPVATAPGLFKPAAFATVGGAALIVLASAAGGVVSLVRRARRRA